MLDHLLRNGLTAMALVFLFYFTAHRTQHKRMRVWPALCVLLFAFCMTAVFSLAGISAMNRFRLPNLQDGFSLIPFKGMIEIVQAGIAYHEPMYPVFNLAGNLLMFAPLGFFLPLIWKSWRRLWKTALFGLGTTLAIEGTQTFVGRGFDVDDLLLNTLGAMLGYGVFRLGRRILPKAVKRCKIPAKRDGFLWRFLPYLCVLIPFAVSFLYGFLDRAIYMR